MNSTLANFERREIKPSAVSSNMQYLIATVIMFAIGMASVIVVSMVRPGFDNSILITAILGFTGTTLASVLAFMKSQETHASVNSRMDDFIRKFEAQAIIAEDKARLEGSSEGRIEGRKQANERTDILAGHALADITIATIQQPTNPLVEIEKHTKETAEVLKEIKDKE